MNFAKTTINISIPPPPTRLSLMRCLSLATLARSRSSEVKILGDDQGGADQGGAGFMTLKDKRGMPSTEITLQIFLFWET